MDGYTNRKHTLYLKSWDLPNSTINNPLIIQHKVCTDMRSTYVISVSDLIEHAIDYYVVYHTSEGEQEENTVVKNISLNDIQLILKY